MRNSCKDVYPRAPLGDPPPYPRFSTDNRRCRFAALSSPLPDSNRRPPPYHGYLGWWQEVGRGGRSWLGESVCGPFGAEGAASFLARVSGRCGTYWTLGGAS